MRRLGAVVVILAGILWCALPACDEDSSGPDGTAGIADLSVDVLEGHISADLMPPVSPDPIVCQLTLRMTNTHTKYPLTGLTVPTGDVVLSADGETLGTIRFQTSWDGSIEPGEVDTVSVTKIEESQEIFPPPCNAKVYVRVKIVKGVVQSKQVTTPSYDFSCPVFQMGNGRH